VPAFIVTFVLPALDVYSWSLAPVLSSLFIGVGVFSSGVIFESMPIVGCSLAWWAGAIAMAFAQGTPRVLTMIGIILVGWVLPGLILHVRYKNRSGDDEA
jgi:hypothetical protein